MTKCLRCNKKAENFLSSKLYPLCDDCHEDWRKVIITNCRKFDAFHRDTEGFHKFWNKLRNEFIQKGKEKVLFT